MCPRISASEKARKTRVVHTPEEIERMIAAAVRILESDPTVPPLSLFRAAQAVALPPSRHRRTETLPRRVYEGVWVEARRSLVTPEPSGTAGELDLIGRGLTVLIEQVGEGRRAQEEALAGLRRDLEGVAREITDRAREDRDEVASLRETVVAVREGLERVERAVDSFRVTLARILGDLTGYAPEGPSPPASVKDLDPVRVASPASGPNSPPRMKVAVLGLKSDQVRRVETEVDPSIRLKIIPRDRRFDDQAIKGCDFVVISNLVGHQVSSRLESLVGRDRVIRPLLPGPGAVIQTLNTISGSAPVSN